jgi:PAS domain S-box-containing protein
VAAADSDPALVAVRAMVHAVSAPMAVFDQAGECLVANSAYVLQAAHGNEPPASGEQRAAFCPDGVRDWTLVSVAAEPAERPALAFVDVVANALPIMFNAKDTQSRYLFMNRYQAELYGVSAADAVGRTATELLGPTYGSHTRSMDAEVIGTGHATPFYEESYAGVDGVPRQWLTSKVPLTGAAGAVWGVATVAVDITERKALERRLQDALEQAEASSRSKSRFLAAMSHELRTPLNAVIGFSELMEQEALGPLGNEEYREYAGHILRSGMHLLQMITNLLDFARVEAGGLELNVGDVEMVRLVRSAAAGASADREAERAPAAPISLDLPQGQLAIRGDEQRLRQILGGLIGNALKFTPAGGQVQVRLQRRDDGAELLVADSGIGMSPEELQHVFEPFWQADSGIGRLRDGAGIGLKLARELVSLHGGSLTLDSEKGRGTQVTLRLPHCPPEPPRPVA